MKFLTGEVIARSLGQVGSMLVFMILGIVVVEAILYVILVKLLKSRYSMPYLLLAPAAVGLLILDVYPLLYEVQLAFTNMSLFHFRDYAQSLAQGLQNLNLLFTEPVLKQAMFLPVLGRTILWTAINVFFHVLGGLGLALLLNRPMRGRGLYRAFLILPWAIPQVIAILAWRGEFHYQYGFVNVMLQNIGLQPIQWYTNPFWNFAAACITNIWLGIPFMMVIILGGLQSIPSEFYEAAEMDGAGKIAQFRAITLPMLQPVLTPAVILGVIWTFNNFNVPYLINQYFLETTDILVTAMFRAAFEFNRYGFSAMFAMVTFLILFVFVVIYMRMMGGLKGVYE
jgi:arabinogalactan oligomer/maltooligosaccharide transport system permease protein